MSWKEWYVERLKKRTVISELKGEKVYLARGSIFSPIPILGEKMKEWHQIYPTVDENTFEINWMNLIIGGKRNLVKLIILLLFFLVVFIGIMSLLGNAKEIMKGDKYVVVTKEAFYTYCNNIPAEDILNKINFIINSTG